MNSLEQGTQSFQIYRNEVYWRLPKERGEEWEVAASHVACLEW